MNLKSLIYIIIIALCISVCYLFKLNSKKDIKINQLSNAIRIGNITKKDSLLKLVENEDFKREFYTTQLSIQSDWIIAYVTILFGVFAIIGLSFFFERINNVKTTLEASFEAKIKKYEEEYTEHKHELIKIKKDTYLLRAKGYLNDGNYNKNTEIGFLSYLLSAYCYFQLIEIEDNESFCEKYLKLLIATLEKSHESLENIKQTDSTTMIKDDLVEIQSKIFEIGKYYNTRIIDLCAMIIIKVNKIGSK